MLAWKKNGMFYDCEYTYTRIIDSVHCKIALDNDTDNNMDHTNLLKKLSKHAPSVNYVFGKMKLGPKNAH